MEALTSLSVRSDDWRQQKKNFVPTGKIDTADEIRSGYLHYYTKKTDLENVSLGTDISYAWQLLEFYDWFFEEIRTDLVINTFLLRQAIVFVGAVAEALSIFHLKQLKLAGQVSRDISKIKFKGANDLMHEKGWIDGALYESLEKLRKHRDTIHLHLISSLGNAQLREKDYFVQRLVLEKLALAFDALSERLGEE